MSNHSVAEARNNLSKLIERASKGESVVITKHGTPVAQITPIKPPPRKMTKADIDWLRQNLVPRKPGPDAGTLIREMREESEIRNIWPERGDSDAAE